LMATVFAGNVVVTVALCQPSCIRKDYSRIGEKKVITYPAVNLSEPYSVFVESVSLNEYV